MYRVVGCRACGALWIVADRPETTECPRCGKRHEFGALHAFYETEDQAAARRARAAVLADRVGHGAGFADVEDRSVGRPGSGGFPDGAELEAAGLDAEAVAEAGERAVAGPSPSRDRRTVVLAALDALDHPTEAEVVDYATERDVPAGAVADLLVKLVRTGAVSESGGRYRRV